MTTLTLLLFCTCKTRTFCVMHWRHRCFAKWR